MKTVRQFSRLGPCAMLGTIVRETRTRIYYRSCEDQDAFVSKSSPLTVHVEPCPSCRDHARSQYPDGYWD
jgi:hypothetical protein